MSAGDGLAYVGIESEMKETLIMVTRLIDMGLNSGIQDPKLMVLLSNVDRGTLHQSGSWSPYGMFPIFIAMGECLGIYWS